MPVLAVNSSRLKEDFVNLSRIGATPEGGVHRPALSQDHLAARQWLLECAAAAGLEVRVDGAGNHSAVLRHPGATKTLLIGSHLDSVPYGGRYDGPLGVLAALEILRTVKEADLRLAVDLEAIDFTDEEGTLVPALGSRAIAGTLTPEALRRPRSGREVWESRLKLAGLEEDKLLSAARDPASLAGFLELHIEQGPRLENAGLPIGVVTGLVGSRSIWVTFQGRASHAGTTPMDARADAGLTACAFCLAAHEIVRERFLDCVANVGQMSFNPGAFNIVPGQAVLSLEFRAQDNQTLESMSRMLRTCAETEAEMRGVTVTWEQISASSPVRLHKHMQAAIVRAANELGLESTRLVSGAGHDVQNLAQITPAGMIFVPSVGGLSHCPQEYSNWEDCINGANVLLGAVLQVASEC